MQLLPREGTFFILGGGGGGGWAVASEGRVLCKFFTNWGGQTCFILNRALGGSQVFWQGKNYSMHVASILYIQAKLPVKINRN